jgi:hypothetical protein
MNQISVIRVLSHTATGLIFMACGAEASVSGTQKKRTSKVSVIISKEASESLKKINEKTPCTGFVSPAILDDE